MLTLTIDRTSLGLEDLTIEDSALADYFVDQEGYSEPETAPQVITATSPYVHGALVTGYRLQTSTMVLSVVVQGNSTTQLENRIGSLRRALTRQATFTITRTLDGDNQTWACQPAGMAAASPIVKGEVEKYLRAYRITVPVYPIPGS